MRLQFMHLPLPIEYNSIVMEWTRHLYRANYNFCAYNNVVQSSSMCRYKSVSYALNENIITMVRMSDIKQGWKQNNNNNNKKTRVNNCYGKMNREQVKMDWWWILVRKKKIDWIIGRNPSPIYYYIICKQACKRATVTIVETKCGTLMTYIICTHHK